MKKCFDRKALNSSEDCNSAKGKEKLLRHVITRRTSVRRGYLIEKCTHAIKESLFASVTCFMRLPRRIQRMLLVMTIPVLALVLTFATISESRAAKTCDCGTAGHETECCWEITEVTKDGKTEKVLTISPGVDENGNTYTSVQMKNYDREFSDAFIGNGYGYQYKTTAPWARQSVTSLVVNDGIESIGKNAFIGEEKIKTADIDNVKTLNQNAFFFATGLTDVKMTNTEKVNSNVFYAAFSLKNIELPNVKFIGYNAFESCRKLESIYMPSVETVSRSAFSDTKLTSIDMPNVSEIGGHLIGQKLKYIGFSTQKDAEGCLIDDRGERVTKGDSNCVTEISIDDEAFINNSFLSNCSADGNGCGSCGYDYVMHGLGCVADCGAGYLGKDGRCIDAANGCGENYKNMGGYCNRIRYTPAEAAKVLRDDGKNEVTITFKQ